MGKDVRISVKSIYSYNKNLTLGDSMYYFYKIIQKNI
jgi:hypothetical protein